MPDRLEERKTRNKALRLQILQGLEVRQEIREERSERESGRTPN